MGIQAPFPAAAVAAQSPPQTPIYNTLPLSCRATRDVRRASERDATAPTVEETVICLTRTGSIGCESNLWACKPVTLNDPHGGPEPLVWVCFVYRTEFPNGFTSSLACGGSGRWQHSLSHTIPYHCPGEHPREMRPFQWWYDRGGDGHLSQRLTRKESNVYDPTTPPSCQAWFGRVEFLFLEGRFIPIKVGFSCLVYSQHNETLWGCYSRGEKFYSRDRLRPNQREVLLRSPDTPHTTTTITTTRNTRSYRHVCFGVWCDPHGTVSD